MEAVKVVRLSQPREGRRARQEIVIAAPYRHGTQEAPGARAKYEVYGWGELHKLVDMGMIGVGIDVVDVARFDGVLKRRGRRFLERVFTERELEDAGTGKASSQRLAGRFAAKEAVLKALGTGLRGIRFKDVEIASSREPGEKGKPIVILHRGAWEGIEVIISISHTPALACAMAVKAVAKGAPVHRS